VPTAVLFFFWAVPIMGAFSADAAVIGFGRLFLMIIAPALLFMALGQACQSGFSGAGFIGTPTSVNILAFIINNQAISLSGAGQAALNRAFGGFLGDERFFRILRNSLLVHI
jgi:Na+-driven multidrug efflux pump